MLKAIKIRLYPDKEQEEYIAKLLGCSRFVYNQLLAYKISEYNENKNNVNFNDLGKKLTSLKEEHPWMRESHSKVLQQSLINLDRAYKNFFVNGNGFPKFKSKHENKLSCRFPSDAIGNLHGNQIDIIKQLKNIHYKCSRKDEIYLNKHQDEIKSGTLSRTKSGHYYFSVLVDRDDVKRMPAVSNTIGIDLGIKDFIVTSDGNRYENLKLRRNNEKILSKLQRQLSKKQNNSKNRDKARRKLAKKFDKLNNKKEFYLHHVVNKLLSENQTIAVEDLNVKGMLKNHNLAKAISELSINRFIEILKYKAEWHGKDIVQVDRFFPSSRLCSCCEEKNKFLSLSDREWKCTSCNTVHDRDLNAAINIMMEAQRIKNIKPHGLTIGLSSPELTLVENSSVDDPAGNRMLKSTYSTKQEKNVIS